MQMRLSQFPIFKVIGHKMSKIESLLITQDDDYVRAMS